MTPEEAERLAALLRTTRQQQGLTAREVARRVGVDVTTITRIERAEFANPRPEVLTAIGDVLGLPAADLFAIADWLPAKQLPTFQPYLRAKYRELPPEAMHELNAFFDRLARKHGIDGPQAGEDER